MTNDSLEQPSPLQNVPSVASGTTAGRQSEIDMLLTQLLTIQRERDQLQAQMNHYKSIVANHQCAQPQFLVEERDQLKAELDSATHLLRTATIDAVRSCGHLPTEATAAAMNGWKSAIDDAIKAERERDQLKAQVETLKDRHHPNCNVNLDDEGDRVLADYQACTCLTHAKEDVSHIRKLKVQVVALEQANKRLTDWINLPLLDANKKVIELHQQLDQAKVTIVELANRLNQDYISPGPKRK